MVEEIEYPQRPVTESEAQAEAARGKAALDVAYPEKGKRDIFIPYVARYRGSEADFWDALRAAAYFEICRSTAARLHRMHNHIPPDKKGDFTWDKLMDHPVVHQIEEHSISLGGGRGRKEAVELGKSAQPVQQVSRWGLRRRRD